MNRFYSFSLLRFITHLSLVLLVILWLIPTIGLLVSSFRTADQISTSGWWSSLLTQERKLGAVRIAGQEVKADSTTYTVSGNIFEEGTHSNTPLIKAWGTSSRETEAYLAGNTAQLENDWRLQLFENGDFVLSSLNSFENQRLPRVFVTALVPPQFTLDNYKNILFNPTNVDGMSKAFISTLTVAIPATIIPVLIAAFAAYALVWMEFRGRLFIIICIVGLLVVPLQLALIPLLKLHNAVGIGKGYLGVWLAHTGFGMPLAIYLLSNYMSGLPRDIIESARVDGASEYKIFTRIILPLSFPALASFAIFQFLWTWNDLLVALVFLLDTTGNTTVMTKQIVELLGSRGGNWEILATAAFISIAVPLLVFFLMQKYLVRGLLAGSVK